MSYPKKGTKTQEKDGKANKKISEDRKQKLLAIQQREQLKGLLVNKFLEKYGGTDKKTSEAITKEVQEYLKNEKMTETSLKVLEDKIKNMSANPKKIELVDQGQKNHQEQKQTQGKLNEGKEKKEEAKEKKEEKKDSHKEADLDVMSETSSKAPKSVYHLGENEDE